MNLNPLSPFSNKPLSDCDERELDAWCAKLLGWWDVKLDNDDWVGCHPANTVTQSIRNYHSDWAAAGPLIERVEWPFQWALCKQRDLYNAKDIGYVVLDSTCKSYEGETGTFELRFVVSADTAPLAIRNAFIIAATHAAQREGGVS